MLNEVLDLGKRLNEELNGINDVNQLESFRLKYLVKKGEIQLLMERMKSLDKDSKIAVGKEINVIKKNVEARFAELKTQFEEAEANKPTIDLTLPGRRNNKGTRHPVNQTLDEIINIFASLGFSVAEGPEIEDGYHNFDALNFPPDHPARDMQDTFFVKSEQELVLRTHTSPVQIRMMESKKPPIRSIMPGRVYRNESMDSTHLAEFHQVEGLYIDKNVSFAELKATMILFAEKLYGKNVEFRFRASFFPFTEPSAELDLRRADGRWMEVCGCGMVHPNVLKAGGIDPEIYSGFAFGFGVERITMLRTGLDDIRMLYENDVRMLRQF